MTTAQTPRTVAPRASRGRQSRRRGCTAGPRRARTPTRGDRDQYPEGMAPVLVRGRGARVLDIDGNWFVEYGMGLRSVTLGHGYGPVSAAVARAAADGVSFSRPTVWELARRRAVPRAGARAPTW